MIEFFTNQYKEIIGAGICKDFLTVFLKRVIPLIKRKTNVGKEFVLYIVYSMFHAILETSNSTMLDCAL